MEFIMAIAIILIFAFFIIWGRGAAGQQRLSRYVTTQKPKRIRRSSRRPVSRTRSQSKRK